MTGPSSQEQLTRTIQLLAEINRLTLRAFQSKNAQALIFLILNDTVPIVRYDRAVLWKLEKGEEPKVLGISGQSKVPKYTDLSKQWLKIVKSIKNVEEAQKLPSPESSEGTSVLWMPIFSHDRPALGLWLERWGNVPWKQEDIDLLKFLLTNYGAAWEKFDHRFSFSKMIKKPLPYLAAALLLSLFLIRVPLRVVAPAEVVPRDPIVITAPLEGIIEEIKVTPGETIKKGQLLFEYDKRVPLQELRVAQKKVEIVESEVNRAIGQAQKDKKALAELAVESLKLKKEELELELAKYRASQLDVFAPDNGVALLDSPEEWHGKPVKIGEKVMVIANPLLTKVRMSVPEDDNVVLDMSKPIKVILNVSPEIGHPARMVYLSSFTHVSDKAVPSFIGEAEWIGDPGEDVKLGLKGTAIIYGEKVSLFYWIVRKPWAYVRRFVGM